MNKNILEKEVKSKSRKENKKYTRMDANRKNK